MKKWLGIRISAGICAALGWWGLLYPQLTFTPDTVSVKLAAEDGTFQEQPLEWDFDSRLYLDLLNADPDKIIFRSRIFTDFSSLLEAFHNGDQ